MTLGHRFTKISWQNPEYDEYDDCKECEDGGALLIGEDYIETSGDSATIVTYAVCSSCGFDSRNKDIFK